MQLRPVKDVCAGVREDIGDLKTVRALPTAHVQMVDPFLFLNHHGPQTYGSQNSGLPFGPHPHRGFETVTFILAGDLMHQDSAGHESIITAGGVQWMTAGRGLVHAEVSSEKFLKTGGDLEILQLWVNLPARLKMTAPRYVGLQENQIPSVVHDEGRVQISLVSGESNGSKGVIPSLTNVTSMIVKIQANGSWSTNISTSENIFFYVARGSVKVNGTTATAFHLVRFENAGTTLEMNSPTGAVVLLCHAAPFNEPVVSYGPFVMNTEEEIQQAIRDYQAGKFTGA